MNVTQVLEVPYRCRHSLEHIQVKEMVRINETMKKKKNENRTNYFQLNEQNKYFHTLYSATMHHYGLLTYVYVWIFRQMVNINEHICAIQCYGECNANNNNDSSCYRFHRMDCERQFKATKIKIKMEICTYAKLQRPQMRRLENQKYKTINNSKR